MRIIVTGGAGYVGAHVVLELLAHGHDVHVVDDLSNGFREALTRAARLAQKPIADSVVDLRRRDALQAVFERVRPDLVAHLAGVKAVAESVANPDKYFDINVHGGESLLDAMSAVDCAKIIFSSSATVYGEPVYLPYDEAHPTRPSNPYGATKLEMENRIAAWCAGRAGRCGVSLRYFNPIGAHVSGDIGEPMSAFPTNLMPVVCSVALGRRETLRIFGADYETRDGTGARDYVHVMDIAEAHARAAAFAARSEGAAAFNLGADRSTTVLELLAAFEQATGQTIHRAFDDRRPGDLPEFFANSSRAREVLGWTAKRDLAAMCGDAWRWHSQNPDGYAKG